MSSHSSANARILHISVTKRMPALTKNEMRPTTCGKSASGTWPRARTASSTAMALASEKASSCTGVGDAVAVERDVVPQLGERPHLAHLGDEADAGIDEEGDASDDLREIRLGHLAARTHRVEHGDGVGEREGELLHRCRPGFLQ